MDVSVIILISSLLIFLYVLYVFVSDDYVLLRKNVPHEKIFDGAFITVFSGMFGARLLYVVSNYDSGFLNPLVFLLFTYFPGLMLTGGIIFSIVTLYLFTKRKKYPVGRIFDLFALAALPAIALGIGLYGLQVVSVIFLALFFVLRNIFFKKGMRDGSVAAIAILFFSFSLLVVRVVTFFKEPVKILGIEVILLLLMLIGAILFLVRYEKLLIYFPTFLSNKKQ
ncbi:MAG: prolipoprotein diacylglyceryl transferase [Candidatus Levybacteria bacterium]|nr:prolipoprotein diacylglyceryl transferase [Candidatus Levybacteria bacterium]